MMCTEEFEKKSKVWYDTSKERCLTISFTIASLQPCELTLSKPPRKHIRRRVAVAQKEAVMSCLRRMKHRRSKKPRNGNGSQNLVPLPPPLPPPPPPTRASPPQGCHIM
uniref:Uncharacterized protein n=1 Tax=Physcomitrium patens TaxID=3218 RepID=A0A7I4CRJ4_PHYPA